jgi:hypothetical protein|nr:MAG TPA_asm: hypothetical protein [Caudoviricetes sp.]
MASIKESSAAKYQLVTAEIKESKDGKTKYVVAEFTRAGLDKLMAAQENSIRLQILPKYGIAEDAANAYLQMWVDTAKAGDYETYIGTYLVGDYEPFLRKDADGKYLTRKKDGKDVKIQFTDVTIYWFSDEEGVPVKGNNYIIRRADNLFQNSTRIVTIADYKKQQAAAKVAKEAAKAATDALVADADASDEDLL